MRELCCLGLRLIGNILLRICFLHLLRISMSSDLIFNDMVIPASLLKELTEILGQSKLAVMLFARELADRVSDQGIQVNSVNPGDVATGLPHHNLSQQALLFTEDLHVRSGQY
jgi:hypothetical protein